MSAEGNNANEVKQACVEYYLPYVLGKLRKSNRMRITANDIEEATPRSIFDRIRGVTKLPPGCTRGNILRGIAEELTRQGFNAEYHRAKEMPPSTDLHLWSFMHYVSVKPSS